MYKKIAVAVVLLFMIGLVFVPVSHASTVTVYVNKNTNDANVTYSSYTYIKVTKNGTSNMANLTFNFLARYFDYNMTYYMNTTQFNRMLMHLNMHNVTIKYSNVTIMQQFKMLTDKSFIKYYNNSIAFNVTGIIKNNTINMSWRGLNGMKLPHTIMGSKTFGFHYNTANYSVFDQSLVKWHRYFNAANNYTVFTYNAGKTVNTYINTTFVNIHIVSDPSYKLIVPGDAKAVNANSIEIINNHTVSYTMYYIIAAVAVIAAIAGLVYYKRR
ncbi:hypothetical protein [Picrophilus oshimae]|uniref:Uncharacterized protein n=1 Tax=Picrophilus torridus (strain ATCC 700027 / DSM 9790 / JCM 10055 / NBRC 100828 / KAW 2/3) TaxID=1122961 RepID=A0A8G2FWA7_PICTO|nr:hypothetical protein [Picrophilus oshimae]SMD30634.1 hypothetical protein SAMN02745355_0524 [Picrophilus oshimae DSM 9789]